MKRLSAIILACALAATGFCSTQVYRLNLDTETGETTLVGMDDVTRRVHLLSEEQYQWVTNICQKWVAYMNADKQRRAIYHGEIVGKTVTTNGTGVITMRTEYQDGFVHEERAVKREPLARPALKKPNQNARKRMIAHPAGISAKQREMREARERIRNKKPKEILIRHDANTGKDEVVK